MTDDNCNVVEIDRPRCSRCGADRMLDELNGYDPLAAVGQRYREAYCRKLADCQSPEAAAFLADLVKHIR
jgi:hypothetical protein